MRVQELVKILLSMILGIIIDEAFSITDTLRELLDPFLVGPFLQPVKPLFILAFYLIEIVAVYQFLDRLKVFERLTK